MKVSVVVPVYNPGPYLEDCIGSLLRQSLPAEEFEAIFVDDGSTDESPARLDALAKEHPHMRVVHQENSGWSGKPRNVGIEAARGEYVFFADNDDWLGDEALERMYAFAKKNDSDVVIGKMAGKGRGVPRELFRKTYDKATLANAPLIDSLTPHKMFRKAFLDKHDLRFPEGRRRLEDHVFVTAAFFAATTISVLSDYVCYYHVRRADDSNAGFQRLEPKKYFGNLCEALDIVAANTEPGRLRDRLYRRWYRVEMIERLRGRRLLQMPDDERQELLDEVRRIAGERFGPGVAAGLPPSAAHRRQPGPGRPPRRPAPPRRVGGGDPQPLPPRRRRLARRSAAPRAHCRAPRRQAARHLRPPRQPRPAAPAAAGRDPRQHSRGRPRLDRAAGPVQGRRAHPVPRDGR